jgi:tetratricopeptide (TPR) repeat protein
MKLIEVIMSAEEISIGELFGLDHPTDIDQSKPVLVVEDQQNMRLIIAHHLQKLQFKNVLQAANGLEAMEKLRQHKDVSAILCNWEMPSMNGLHLIAEMRENAHVNRIPFCLMISNVSKEKIMLAIEHGVDDMLVKPLKLVDLIPKIRNSFKVFYNKSNPEPVYELAKKAMNDSNWDEAERIYRELSIASPNTARPLVGLAKVAWGKKELGNALNFLEEAETNNPNYVHLFSYRGKILAEQGKLDEGLSALKHAVALSPLNPIRYQDCVNLLIEHKRYEEVTAVLEGAVKEDVQFPELYKYFSEAYYNLKDYKKAIKYIRSAVGLDPENTVFLNQLAVSLKESGDHAEAQKTYNKVLKLEPKNLQALYNKALLLAQTGQINEAIKVLERTSKVYPDFEKAVTKLNELKIEVTKEAG